MRLQEQQQQQHQQQQQQQQQEEEEEQQEEQEEQQEQEEQAQKCDKGICGKMVTSWDMKRTSRCALHLRARAEHMHNTDAHTTIRNPYGIAGVRSSTI